MTNGSKPNYGQPALIGGLVMGVLSALPLVSAGNICCCLWVVTGGLVAAYLLQQNQAMPISRGRRRARGHCSPGWPAPSFRWSSRFPSASWSGRWSARWCNAFSICPARCRPTCATRSSVRTRRAVRRSVPARTNFRLRHLALRRRDLLDAGRAARCRDLQEEPSPPGTIDVPTA